MDVLTVETKLLEVITALAVFAHVDTAGRKAIPEPGTYGYPACFVYWDGDDDTGTKPRPVDATDFAVIVQVQNYASEAEAAKDIYTLNDVVRAAIRGKSFGLAGIEPFDCLSRRLTDYAPEEGMIEYTHMYRTRMYQPVPVDN